MTAYSRTKSLKLKHVVYVPFGASVLDNEKIRSWRPYGVER